jgi:hypothetical protein
MPRFTSLEKVETKLVGQVSEIGDQVGDSMLVAGTTVSLKSCDCFSGRGDVLSGGRHTLLLNTRWVDEGLPGRLQPFTQIKFSAFARL